jgi:hypothetical protein
MYSTDYNDYAVLMLPPNYRLDRHKAWMRSQLAPMVWSNERFFEKFIDGDNSAEYNAGTTYAFQDRVKYNGAIYESQQDSNTGEDINDTDWWVLYNTNWVGASERILYSASKLIFEYALNKWFGGTFAQPPSTSDIYITNNASVAQTFYIGITTGSNVGKTVSSEFIPEETSTFTSTADFTINIPTALYPAGGDEEVRQFSDKINTAGLTYDIVQY